jgi:poly(hydroxyalkanoate) depolymerase family esterase
MPKLRELWSRLVGFVGGLFRRAPPPPAPGAFVRGTKLSWRGFVATAPLVAPQREYLAYVPARASGPLGWRRHPLVVLLHGCRQTPEVIAAATRAPRLADAEELLVLLPRQHPRANPWGCWNWFDAACAHGWGEPAIVAAQIRALRRGYRIDRRRVFVAGLSSGGALAAILGLRRPDLVAGVFVHSGVACGAASSPYAALGVLKHGANTDVVKIGTQARAAAAPETLPVPLLVVQGGSDDVVAPVNAAQLVRQYLAFNGHPAAAAGAPSALPPADRSGVVTTAAGRTVTTSEWTVGARLVARHVLVDALGHAWSGGDASYPYNDEHEPDATALLGAFVREVVQ